MKITTPQLVRLASQPRFKSGISQIEIRGHCSSHLALYKSYWHEKLWCG